MSKVQSLREEWISKVVAEFTKQYHIDVVKVRKATASAKTVAAVKHAVQVVLEDGDVIDDWMDVYQDAGLAISDAFAAMLEADLSEELDGLDDPTDSEVADALTRYVAAYVQARVPEMLGATADLVNRHVDSQVDDKAMADDARAAVDDAYDMLSTTGATALGEYETIHASNYGMSVMSGLLSSELEKTWVAILDEHTRPWHADMDGTTVSADEPFVVDDEELMFPTDDSLGATGKNLYNCRCIATYGAQSGSKRIVPRVTLKWDEDQHPRDSNGRFQGSGVADFPGTPPSDPAERGAYVGKVVEEAGGMTGKYATCTRYGNRKTESTYTKAREELHQKIADEYLAKYASIPRDHQALISGGLPGAGKTSSLNDPSLADEVGVDTSQYMPINSDDFKEILAGEPDGFVQVDSLEPMEHASFLHEEAGVIADMVAARAQAEGMNVLHDITVNKSESISDRVQELEKLGYTVRGAFVDVPVEVAEARAEARYERGVKAYQNGKGLGGRYVPKSVIEKQRAPSGSKYRSKNRQYFEDSKHLFNGGYVILDNSGDKSDGYPKLVEAKRRSSATVIARFDRFVKEWDEDAHPRDANGRFGEGGGDTAASAPDVSAQNFYSHMLNEHGSTLHSIELEQRNWAEGNNETVEQYQEHTEDLMRAALANGTPQVRVPQTALVKILNEGRFKTSFEEGARSRSAVGSKPSKVEQYLNLRAEAEQDMFGYSKDMNPEDRPVYGYYSDQPNGGMTYEEYGTPGYTPGSHDWLEQYGDCAVVLNDEVNDRATVSFGDSLDDAVSPSPYNDPRWFSYPYTMNSEVQADHSGGNLLDSHFKYAEAQYHGGLKSTDIKKVIIKGTPSAKLIKALDKAGIPWEAMPKPSWVASGDAK